MSEKLLLFPRHMRIARTAFTCNSIWRRKRLACYFRLPLPYGRPAIIPLPLMSLATFNVTSDDILDGWMLTAGVHFGWTQVPGIDVIVHASRPQRPLTVHSSPHPPHSLPEWRTNGSTFIAALVVPDDRLRRHNFVFSLQIVKARPLSFLQHPSW